MEEDIRNSARLLQRADAQQELMRNGELFRERVDRIFRFVPTKWEKATLCAVPTGDLLEYIYPGT